MLRTHTRAQGVFVRAEFQLLRVSKQTMNTVKLHCDSGQGSEPPSGEDKCQGRFRPITNSHDHSFLRHLILTLAASAVLGAGCGKGGLFGDPREATSPARQTSINPKEVNFGNVPVGTTSTLPVTLTNTATTGVLLSQLNFSGASFSLSGLSLPLILTPGQSTTFNVMFAPTTNGGATGTIAISAYFNESGGGEMDITISLSGTGITLTLSLTPASTNFGNTVINQKETLPVLVTNTGNADVTITQATVAGLAFSFSGLSLPLTLMAGQSISFSVTFSPTSAGDFSGSVSLISNGTDSPTVEQMTGAGVKAYAVTLSWEASTSPDILGYNVYRGVTSGGPYIKITSSLVSSTSFVDSTVVAGQTYFYVATAVNSNGDESAYSNQAEATVPSP